MKRNIIVLAIITLIFSGCRKEEDYHPYIGEYSQLAYDSYASQFEYIWKCVSTGYVFWDIEKIDWDVVYGEYMPKFEALDARHLAGEAVMTSEILELYTAAMGGLIDHHMEIKVKNLFPTANEEDPVAVINPAKIELQTRDYYIEDYTSSAGQLMTSFMSYGSMYEIEDAEMATFLNQIYYFYCMIKLPDGRKIPYLWQSQANLTNVLKFLGAPDPYGAAATLVDRWFTTIQNTPREELAGFILDNRCNSGGNVADLDYIVGAFVNTPTEVFLTRYKEGPGRLEHSAWLPLVVNPSSKYHRDITAENIPFVILCDMYSISMGELEPLAVRNVLPTSYLIGERTYGATGPLFSNVDFCYSGPFGDINTMNHYVYTASFESMVDGKILEGYGITPDKVVNRKDHNNDYKSQLVAAIEYIQSVH